MATPAPIRVLPAAAFKVPVAGKAVTAVFAGVAGGLLQNPLLAVDQGIVSAEVLFVDMSGATAVTAETATCFAVQPGGKVKIPAGTSTTVSVNAKTAGHRFSAIVLQPPPGPSVPQPGAWPPASSPAVQAIIPSYIYVQYNDDDDVQAFARAYNALAQSIIARFTGTPFPIYTDPAISGPMLDWIGAGLYGLPRPALASGVNRNLGPYNTAPYNVIAYNGRKIIGPQNVVATTDDIYKRILTWNFSRIDGYYFSVPWLKRRIMRFLLGVNGTQPPVPSTAQVSVTFGVNNQVNVRLISIKRDVTAGPYNTQAYNVATYNSTKATIVNYPALPNAAIFIEAAQSGALQLPFEWDFVFVSQ